MLFNSFSFLVFLPIVVLVYYCIPNRVRYIWLLITSYYFYMNWNAKYALLLFLSTFITYLCGRYIDRVNVQKESNATQKKKICVAVGVGANLAILVFFKYFNFVIDNLNVVFGNRIEHFDVILPVGISFYTFQALGYIIDVYRGEIKAEKNLLKYALFVSFFPQLVAGPIERSKNLLEQINQTRKFDFEKMRDGIFLMVWGYFLKIVIADRIAIFVDTVYGDIDTFGGWYLVLATALFAIQIYCDFAGYSVIAMGTAKLLGFSLMENFNAPYLSSSVTEFWRRWHISLSSWFKDYLYIPLGGNRKGKWKKYRNTMLVFLLSGLWHGASWTYVIWGGLNGIYQVLEDIFKIGKKNCKSIVVNIVRIGITFILVDFTWVFFRAENITQAFAAIKSMLMVHNLEILLSSSLFDAGLSKLNFVVLFVALGILLIADICKNKNICIRTVIQKQNYFIRTIILVVSILAVFVFGIWGTGYDAAGFIYFQF